MIEQEKKEISFDDIETSEDFDRLTREQKTIVLDKKLDEMKMEAIEAKKKYELLIRIRELTNKNIPGLKERHHEGMEKLAEKLKESIELRETALELFIMMRPKDES